MAPFRDLALPAFEARLWSYDKAVSLRSIETAVKFQLSMPQFSPARPEVQNRRKSDHSIIKYILYYRICQDVRASAERAHSRCRRYEGFLCRHLI